MVNLFLEIQTQVKERSLVSNQAEQLKEISNAVQRFDDVSQHNAQMVETANVTLNEAVSGVQKVEDIAASFVIEDGSTNDPVGIRNQAA